MKRINEIFLLSLSALRANLLRAFLTTLGNVIGVMTVIAVVSLIQGMNRYVTGKIRLMGSSTFYVDKFGLITSEDEFFEALGRKNLTSEDGFAIKERCPSVKAVCVIQHSRQKVKFRDNTLFDIEIDGATGDISDAYENIELEEGRYPTFEDSEHKRYFATVGYEIKESLFGVLNPMGRYIKIGNREFKVIGVAKKQGSLLGQSMDKFVVIPISCYRDIFGPQKEPWFNSPSIAVKAIDQERLDIAKDEVTMLLRARRHVKPGKPNDFGVMTAETFIDLYNNFTRVAYIVMVGISSISLVVGGIVVMNIMLVSVTERTREIGIRKACGARREDILYQFLLEAVAICAIGGIAGIVLGGVAAKIISSISPLPSSVELWSVIAGLLVACSVGIFFGLYPALKAAKLDPVVALRYE